MRRRTVCGIALLAAAAIAWAGNDPWKAKPYQQWDKNDVEKIMGDSPWAKVVRIDRLWKNVAPTISDADTRDLAGGAASGGGGGDTDSDPSHPAALRQPGEGTQLPQAAFLARWTSSRTMRAAVLRGAVIAGKIKDEMAAKELAVPVDAYEVEILGPDMQPFQGLDEKVLAQNAYLQTKKKKYKIPPAQVEIERDKSGKKILAVAYLFPKKSASGEATIAADEKGADFNCTAGKAKIQVSFDLAKMEDGSGRDL
jgi:hypothetical protein